LAKGSSDIFVGDGATIRLTSGGFSSAYGYLDEGRAELNFYRDFIGE
jgi:hypothetical protein